MNFDVFISYSTKDSIAAKAACAAMESAKIRCWMAPRDIVPGAKWGASIVRAINQCRVMVLIFSGNANNSAQVQREVDQAFGKGKAVLPLRIEDVKPADELAYYLDTVHWLDALTPPLEKDLGKLVATVQALLPATEPAPPSSEPVLDDAQAAQAQDEARAVDERRLKEVEAAQRAEAAQREKDAAEAGRKKQEAEAQRAAEDRRRKEEEAKRRAEEEERRKREEAELKQRAEAERAFAKAKRADTVAALDAFLAAYPASHLIAEAEVLRTTLSEREDVYKSAMASDSPAVLSAFLDRYPRAARAGEIRERLNRLEQPRGARRRVALIASAAGIAVVAAGAYLTVPRSNSTNDVPETTTQPSGPVIIPDLMEACFAVQITGSNGHTLVVLAEKGVDTKKINDVFTELQKQLYNQKPHLITYTLTGGMDTLMALFSRAKAADGAKAVMICSKLPRDRIVSALQASHLI